MKGFYRGIPPGMSKDGRAPITFETILNGLSMGIDLPIRHDLLNKSQEFAWGYGGSGPAQTALAILAHACGDQAALDWWPLFKDEVIARQPIDGELLIDAGVVRELVAKYERTNGGASPDPAESAGELYTEQSRLEAPPGHMPLPGTPIEVVAYRSGANLTVLVNHGPRCIYRATLINAGKLDPKFTAATAILSDTFVVREFPAAGAHNVG